MWLDFGADAAAVCVGAWKLFLRILIIIPAARVACLVSGISLSLCKQASEEKTH